MTRIVIISAGLSEPSSTQMLADAWAERIQSLHSEASVEAVSLRPLAHEIVDQSRVITHICVHLKNVFFFNNLRLNF